MMSWEARRKRRGGISQDEFLKAMADAGFVVVPCDSPLLAFKFTHPDTLDRSYAVASGEDFSRAFSRMTGDLKR